MSEKMLETNTLLKDTRAEPTYGAEKPQTKMAVFRELLRDPAAYDKIDKAWRLLMMLLFVENGCVMGTYETIAKRLGDVSASSVKAWASSLKDNGIIDRCPEGKQVRLQLLGDYMAVAKAPDTITVETVEKEDSRAAGMRMLTDGVKTLGCSLVITVQGGVLDGRE
jgi:DNA-binding transcriptional ArsR family regulator